MTQKLKYFGINGLSSSLDVTGTPWIDTLERAMGIEPTRAALPELENTGFRVMPTLKCDGRVNFRGMWGHVGLLRDTSVAEIPVALAALFQGI